MKNSSVSFENGDVETYQFSNYDIVFNLACPASPDQYQKDPLKTFTTSVLGVMNICDCIKNTDTILLHASTSEVYGDPTVHPQNENYWGNVNPIGLRSCYDEGKRAAETYLTDFAKIHKSRIIICRIFNTYGPNLNKEDGRVFSNFLHQAMENRPLSIYGDGTQTRSLCYVDDTIDIFLKLICCGEEIVGPVNVGNDTEYSILEIAGLIVQLTGSKSNFEFKKLPEDDPKKRRPDLTVIRNILKWSPQVTLSQGIQLCIDHEH